MCDVFYDFHVCLSSVCGNRTVWPAVRLSRVALVRWPEIPPWFGRTWMVTLCGSLCCQPTEIVARRRIHSSHDELSASWIKPTLSARLMLEAVSCLELNSQSWPLPELPTASPLLVLVCAFISSAEGINPNYALRCYIWDEQREKWGEFRRKKCIVEQ